MKKLLILIIAVTVFCYAFMGCSPNNASGIPSATEGNGQEAQGAGAVALETPSETNESTSKTGDIFMDVSQFSKITPEQLKKIMGEPNSIEQWLYKGATKKFSVTSYYYQNSKLEFHVVNGVVVRLNIYSDFTFSSKKDMLKAFGINPSINYKVTKTPAALRYSNISDKITDFWIVGDAENLTFDTIKITYIAGCF